MTKKKNKSNIVTLVQDPFQITPENDPRTEEQRDLDDLAEAIAQAEKEDLAQMESLVQPEENSEEKLLREIAEDQALTEETAEALAAAEEATEALSSVELDENELQSCCEALLFMSDRPISNKKLKELLGGQVEVAKIKAAIAAIRERYEAVHHGFELVEVDGGFQFRTKVGRAELARQFAKVQTQRLSRGAMESLAIIAYKQPILKEEIDKIRGVDSSYFLRGLLDRKLIQMSGRSELPGRPILYGTTPQFLEIFGLADLSAMPPLQELEKMIPSSQSANPEEEDPKVRKIRELVGQMNRESGSLEYNPREDDEILKGIRERIGSIAISTPYLEAQKEAAKAAENGETVSSSEAEIPAQGLLTMTAPEAPMEAPAATENVAE